ncbi:MAG: hypothetical protein OXD36_02295 [Rhodobacter sp.]|nr:hypothetical protein [Rhodobacter sp.]
MADEPMPVRWNFWTGHISEIIPTLRKALGAYARHNAGFKVGITANPEGRWRQHRKDGWREMVVIYRTASPDSVREAERLLIEHGWECHPDAIWNEQRGGGGGPMKGKADAYFVYVVLA